MLKAEQQWVREVAERIVKAAIREAIRPLEARIEKLEKVPRTSYAPTKKPEVKDVKL